VLEGIVDFIERLADDRAAPGSLIELLKPL